jgi:hypothetical protein
MSKEILERIRKEFQEYMLSYQRGHEKFGVWWTLLTLSMLSLALVFITVALILAIFYL